MKRSLAVGLATTLACLVTTVPLRADKADQALARQAFSVLKKNCAVCHHGPEPKSEVEDYDVLSHVSLTKKRLDDEKKTFFYVSPKKLNKSLLWDRVSEGTMPPAKAQVKPTAKERAILKKWIEAGAPAWPAPKKEEKTGPVRSGSHPAPRRSFFHHG